MAKKRRHSRSPGVHGEVCSSDNAVAGHSGTEVDEERRLPTLYSSEISVFLYFADFHDGPRVTRRSTRLADYVTETHVDTAVVTGQNGMKPAKRYV